MSLITGRVYDQSITMNVHRQGTVFNGIAHYQSTEYRTLEVCLSIEVSSMPLSNTDPVRQLLDEIVADVNEAIGAGGKRPGAMLIQQLQEQNSNLALAAHKHESEAIRLQGIIDAFQKGNADLIMNSTTVRNAMKENRNASKKSSS